jgi:hypothetical protein
MLILALTVSASFLFKIILKKYPIRSRAYFMRLPEKQNLEKQTNKHAFLASPKVVLFAQTSGLGERFPPMEYRI